MMKILVGVDLEGTCKSALRLAARLHFPEPSWTLANIVQPIATYAPGFAPLSIPAGQAVDVLHEKGHEAIAQARDMVGAPDKDVTELVIDGNPAAALMRIADEEHADLVITGSGLEKQGFPWMIGSVSRALCFGAKQSLLVSKQPGGGEGPVHAIFATDHSDYANSALESLLAWAPKGLRRIDVLTAYEMSGATAALLRESTEVEVDFEDWLQEHATKQCRSVAERLRAIAAETHVMVEKGPVNEVIANAMSSTGADLLIVGAQGHGFIERILVGSTSMHQILSEPYPVLLIRLPK